MAQDLGGFTIARSTSVTMLLIFSVYSIIIVGFGFYVKAQARKGGSDNLTSFLTGGGNIGAFSIAMIAATNAMSGGSMVAAPGLSYAVGFASPLIYYSGFLTSAYCLVLLDGKLLFCVNGPARFLFAAAAPPFSVQGVLWARWQSRRVGPGVFCGGQIFRRCQNLCGRHWQQQLLSRFVPGDYYLCCLHGFRRCKISGKGSSYSGCSYASGHVFYHWRFDI